MKTCFTALLLLGRLGYSTPARAQQLVPEPLAAAVEAAVAQYNRAFVGPPQLYNGPEYVDYAMRYHDRTGHQFFISPEKQPGSVHYNGHYFPNLRLSYDVVLQQVVIRQPTSPLNLRLINEQMQEFSIDGHRFVRLLADSTADHVISTGYYEILVDHSRLQLVAKRAKALQEVPGQGFLNVEFNTVDNFFLKRANTYSPINSKRAVLRSFADYKKEVQQYIKAQHLRFGKATFDASLLKLTLYYVSLPPQ